VSLLLWNTPPLLTTVKHESERLQLTMNLSDAMDEAQTRPTFRRGRAETPSMAFSLKKKEFIVME
jgi:hypothetical protein